MADSRSAVFHRVCAVGEGVAMNDLQKYIDSLPEPKTLREKILVWWSNLIDFFGRWRKNNGIAGERKV